MNASAPVRFRTPLVVAVSAICLFAAACSQGARSHDGPVADGAPPPATSVEAPPMAPQAGAGAAPAVFEARSPSPATAATDAAAQRVEVPEPSERKVILNGTMQIEVADLGAATEAIRAHVDAVGGFIAAESTLAGQPGRARSGSLTLRVPAPQLDATVARLRTLGEEQSLTLNAEDVTEQYFDLEIQLRNRRELESRLRLLMARPGNDLSDLLEIEKEVARVRSEIEQMEGRKRFWDNRVSFATLAVTLQEPAPLIAGAQGGVWQTLTEAFREAGNNFVAAVAGVIAAAGLLLPLSIALAVVLLGLRAIWKRTHRVGP